MWLLINNIERIHMTTHFSREIWVAMLVFHTFQHGGISSLRLCELVKKRYLEKISCVGIDPVLISDKTYDPESLSPVESMDREGKIETSCVLALTAFASSNSHAELTM